MKIVYSEFSTALKRAAATSVCRNNFYLVKKKAAEAVAKPSDDIDGIWRGMLFRSNAYSNEKALN